MKARSPFISANRNTIAPGSNVIKKAWRVGISKIAGRGLFATRNIFSGERIIEYVGELISQDEADARHPEPTSIETAYTTYMTLADDIVIDPSVNGNEAQLANHSCDPNCELEFDGPHVYIVARKPCIYKGEELTYDYELTLGVPHTRKMKKLHPCYCGAKKCRGTLLIPKRERRSNENPATHVG